MGFLTYADTRIKSSVQEGTIRLFTIIFYIFFILNAHMGTYFLVFILSLCGCLSLCSCRCSY